MISNQPNPPGELLLRDVASADLPIFFEQQLDPEANFMAAFTAKDPADRAAFLAHWNRILADASVINQTIVVDGQVAGSIARYVEEGRPEVTYWLGREFWGRGIATRALAQFLAQHHPARPIYARAAKDNLASRRVLEKCGFVVCGQDHWLPADGGEEIREWKLVLE